MLRLRYFLLGAVALLLTAVTAAPQNQQNNVRLSATQTYLAVAPPNTPSTLLSFQVAVEGRKEEVFDVVSANPASSLL